MRGGREGSSDGVKTVRANVLAYQFDMKLNLLTSVLLKLLAPVTLHSPLSPLPLILHLNLQYLHLRQGGRYKEKVKAGKHGEMPCSVTVRECDCDCVRV